MTEIQEQIEALLVNLSSENERMEVRLLFCKVIAECCGGIPWSWQEVIRRRFDWLLGVRKQDARRGERIESGEQRRLTMEIYDIIGDCPKCGRTRPETKYINDDLGERMERYCDACGYQWNELPLDQEGIGEPEEANDA